ncbi:MAG: hypothetical protein ACRD21_13240 [Vicinamibacteria bacterium]
MVPYSDRELARMLSDVESDLTERKRSRTIFRTTGGQAFSSSAPETTGVRLASR